MFFNLAWMKNEIDFNKKKQTADVIPEYIAITAKKWGLNFLVLFFLLISINLESQLENLRQLLT